MHYAIIRNAHRVVHHRAWVDAYHPAVQKGAAEVSLPSGPAGLLEPSWNWSMLRSLAGTPAAVLQQS